MGQYSGVWAFSTPALVGVDLFQLDMPINTVPASAPLGALPPLNQHNVTTIPVINGLLIASVGRRHCFLSEGMGGGGCGCGESSGEGVRCPTVKITILLPRKYKTCICNARN